MPNAMLPNSANLGSGGAISKLTNLVRTPRSRNCWASAIVSTMCPPPKMAFGLVAASASSWAEKSVVLLLYLA